MHHPSSVNLVKEFAEFKQKSNVLRKPEVPKEQGKRSKDDSLEKIDQLENLIVTKGESRGQSTSTKTTVEDTTTSMFTESKVEEDGTSYQTSETTDGPEPETPKTLSLTSDSHKKRGPLDDLNQDDGTRILFETEHYCYIVSFQGPLLLLLLGSLSAASLLLSELALSSIGLSPAQGAPPLSLTAPPPSTQQSSPSHPAALKIKSLIQNFQSMRKYAFFYQLIIAFSHFLSKT